MPKKITNAFFKTIIVKKSNFFLVCKSKSNMEVKLMGIGALLLVLGIFSIASASSAVSCFNDNDAYKQQNLSTFQFNGWCVFFGILQAALAGFVIFSATKGKNPGVIVPGAMLFLGIFSLGGASSSVNCFNSNPDYQKLHSSTSDFSRYNLVFSLIQILAAGGLIYMDIKK